MDGTNPPLGGGDSASGQELVQKKRTKSTVVRGPGPKNKNKDGQAKPSAKPSGEGGQMGRPALSKKDGKMPAKGGEGSKAKGKAKASDKTDPPKEIRNRASPARFFNLNSGLFPQQRIALIKEFGGLLNIGACTMPVDLSQWVMKCYDHVGSQLVIPNRGKIPVDADSVYRVWRLPHTGLKVCYEMQTDLIKAINSEYGFPGTNAPKLTAWCKMIKAMGEDSGPKFVRAWAVVVFNCFLAPTTGLKVSPRCYPAVMHVDLLPVTNICQFVVDQIRVAFTALGNKKYVCCCVFHLVLLYLDSLEVDELISNCEPRADAWDSALIAKVKNEDRISPGVFGKLQLKEKYRDTQQGGLFGGLLKAEQFVSALLPSGYDQSKKRKIAAMVGALSSELEESVGKFVRAIGTLDQDDHVGTSSRAGGVQEEEDRPRKKQRRTQREVVEPVLDENDSTDSDDRNNNELNLEDEESEEIKSNNDDDEDADAAATESDGDDDEDAGVGDDEDEENEGDKEEHKDEEDEEKEDEDEEDEEERGEDDDADDDNGKGGAGSDNSVDDDNGGNDGGPDRGGAQEPKKTDCNSMEDENMTLQFYVQKHKKNWRGGQEEES